MKLICFMVKNLNLSKLITQTFSGLISDWFTQHRATELFHSCFTRLVIADQVNRTRVLYGKVFPKLVQKKNNTQSHPCLYFHFSKHLMRTICSSSNDFADLNVLVIPVLLPQHTGWDGEIVWTKLEKQIFLSIKVMLESSSIFDKNTHPCSFYFNQTPFKT